MPKQLTVHNATITTAAVEVKTLTIIGKQVTLAVFRQLREEPLVDDDGTLNGVPWGFVNYHPDKCGGDGHWHIVWQRGDELLRSRVDKTPDFDQRRALSGPHPAHQFHSETADRFLTAGVYEQLHADNECLLLGHREIYGTREYLAGRVLDDKVNGPLGFPVLASAAKEAVKAADLASRYTAACERAQAELSPYQRSNSEEWQRQRRAQYQEEAEVAQRDYGHAMDALRCVVEKWGGTEEIKRQYGAELRQERDRRQRHRDVRTTLAELPQLFIAV